VTSEAIPVTITQAVLGEGLRWDARRQELLGVDILTGRVYRGRVEEDGSLSLVGQYQLPGTVGAIAPVHDDEGWIVAAGQGFLHLGSDGSLRPIAEVSPAGTRMNDGACDPQGRFWAGTLADDFRPGGGALYRLDGDGNVEVIRRDLTISNGLGWSPDGATMYLADSGPGVVYAFTFDPGSGTLADDRPFVTIPEEVGTPDGLTVDTDGDVWVAIYGGGRIHRYSPAGVLREQLVVPAHQSTSCTFAGADLNRLYVTTATEGWSDAQRQAEPGAGLVYRFDVDATGRAATLFRPDPAWWPAPGSGSVGSGPADSSGRPAL
jgi:sugar lactone lactonase YvrE